MSTTKHVTQPVTPASKPTLSSTSSNRETATALESPVTAQPSMSPKHILQLQRLIGNKAVQRVTGNTPNGSESDDDVVVVNAGGVPMRPAGGAPVANPGGAPVANAGGVPMRPVLGPVVNQGGAPLANMGGAPVANVAGAPVANAGGAPMRPALGPVVTQGGAPLANVGGAPVANAVAAPVAPPVLRPAAPPPAALLTWTQFKQHIMDAAHAPLMLGRPNPAAAVPAATPLAQRQDAILNPLKIAYEVYDGDSSLTNLATLYHKIDHWQTMYWNEDALRSTGLRTPDFQALLQSTKHAIEQKIRATTAVSGIDSTDDIGAVLSDSGKKEKAVKQIDFFEEVGVPAAFYSKLTKPQVALFKKLYEGLKKNKPKLIPELVAKLTAQNIVGFPLIKGLFLIHFPAAAGTANLQNPNFVSSRANKEAAFESKIKMHNLFGTADYTDEEMEAEEYAGDQSAKRTALENNLGGKSVSKSLSNAELSALLWYTGGGYDTANSVLRENGTGPSDNPTYQATREETKSKSEVVVSALNKLPSYNGIAYRMQNGFADFDAAVQPGGMFTDLAFMSASMTAQGAELGGASGGAGKAGALEVFEIIHTKSARKVTILSHISQETEVLFSPGAKFKVQAIWKHINGQVPKDAPTEAQMILLRNGDTKTRTNGLGTFTGTVRVVELVEV